MSILSDIINAILGKTTLQAVVALSLTGVFVYLAVGDKIPTDALLIQFGFVTGWLFKDAITKAQEETIAKAAANE